MCKRGIVTRHTARHGRGRTSLRRTCRGAGGGGWSAASTPFVGGRSRSRPRRRRGGCCCCWWGAGARRTARLPLTAARARSRRRRRCCAHRQPRPAPAAQLVTPYTKAQRHRRRSTMCSGSGPGPCTPSWSTGLGGTCRILHSQLCRKGNTTRRHCTWGSPGIYHTQWSPHWIFLRWGTTLCNHRSSRPWARP